MAHSIPVEHLHVGYGQKGQDLVLSPQLSKQIKMFQVKLLNRSGDLCDIGVLRKLAAEQIKVFSSDGLNTSDITNAINSAASSTVFDLNALPVSDAALILQAKRRINLVGINVLVAQTGTPVYQIQYYNGSAFVSVPDVIQVIDFANTGYALLVFNSPLDQVVGGEPNTDQTLYTIKIVATTAPTTPVDIDSVQIASMIDFASGVNVGSGIESNFTTEYPFHLDSNEGILPFFSTANDKNLVSIFYSQDD